MARGGKREGAGRKFGSKTKATVEREERARLERQAKEAEREKSIAERKHIKLAKDVLEDYMVAFGAIASVFQNKVVESLQKGLTPSQSDVEAFERWGRMTVDTAAKLADYQSPKLKAVMVGLPPPSPNGPMVDVTPENVRKLPDANSKMASYADMIRVVGTK